MTKQNISSPLTGGATRRVRTVTTADVLEAYRKSDLLDVALPYISNTESVDIMECLDTGYRFYYPYSIFGDDKFYEMLQKKTKHYYHQRWEFTPAADVIKEGDSVLEIGCGHGDFLELIADKTDNTLGLELNNKAIQAAKKRGLNVIGQTIQEYVESNSEKHDVVCMFQVLEHIWEVDDFLSSAIKAIKPGGLLIIGVPNNNPYLFKHDVLHALNLPPHHSGLWNSRSLSELGRVFSLDVVKIKVEPLHELELYWRIQKQHWQSSKPALYKLADSLPGALTPLRNFILTRFCQGRNVVAIYRKTN